MANQMIALQARAPQSAGIGNAIQQNAQMINMLTQQRAAERQNALAAQKMALEAQMAGPQLAKATSDAGSARLKFIKDFMDTSAFGIANARNAQDALRVGEILKAEFNDAELNEAIDQTLASIPQDPAAFEDWRQDALMRTMDASKQLEYMLPKVKSELATSETGEPLIATYGGLNAPTIKQPRSLIRAPSRTGTVEVGEQTTVEPGMGGPVNADEVERFIQSFPREAQAAIRQRVNEGALGNIPMGSPVASGLVTGERGGVGGPDEGYVEAPAPFRLKNPMQSPAPGVYSVPTTTIREKAEAERPSAAETYGKARAEEQAKNDVKFLEGVNSARRTAIQFMNVIDSMIGDARLNKNGQIEIPPGGRAPHPGFEDVVGATWRPGARFFPGTNAADFDAYLEQTEGGSFLEAYDILKGGGPIATAEGEKATRAISRMKRSTSEKEFIKAARELRGMIEASLASADAREARLRGKTPTAKSSGGKRLRYDPVTGDVK